MSKTSNTLGVLYYLNNHDRIISDGKEMLGKFGPFFIIEDLLKNEDIYGYRTDLTVQMVKDSLNAFVDSDITHMDLFDIICDEKKELYLSKDDDYGYYPRGRVLYNIKIETFYIYVDKCILNNNELKNLILNYFDIVNKKYIFLTDDHYTCHCCDNEI